MQSKVWKYSPNSDRFAESFQKFFSDLDILENSVGKMVEKCVCSILVWLAVGFNLLNLFVTGRQKI
jgi:hypothetical protein